jgi:hypothetical protein
MTVKNCSVVLLALVVGCAEGAPVEGDDDPVDARAGEADASDPGDDDPDAGEAEGEPDAGVVKPGDPDAAPLPVDAAPAPVDAAPAPPDAAPAPPDAAPPVCTTTQLLLNPAFDESPIGNRWTQSPVAITDDGPVAPHTPPNSLWLGGFNSRTENVYQAVAVPAGVTSLELIVKYLVINPEDEPDVYDSATLTVRSNSGTVLHTLRQWSNTDPASTGWEVATFAIPSSVAGQTVRIHFAGRTDFTVPTSFQFDSLELNATVCP